MAISYGFDLDYFQAASLAAFVRSIQPYGNQQTRKAAIIRTRNESRRAFLDWAQKQAELIADEMADAAPSRSGNLADSIFTKPEGRDWAIEADDERAPYAKWVVEGRGPIFPRRGFWLIFPDTRRGWRPMSNLFRVGGTNSQKYPYTGNLRARHVIPKVGGAPSIDFPGEGFDRWDRELLPQQTQILRDEINRIVLENGGRVIRSS